MAVALETVVELKPGPYELVAVAREVTTDRVVSSRTEGTGPIPTTRWPRSCSPSCCSRVPAPSPATESPQERLARPRRRRDPLDPRARRRSSRSCAAPRWSSRRSTCRARWRAPLRWTSLPGLDLGSERCGQVRDMIPAKTLGPGRYRYQIVVKEKGTEIGRGETSFVVRVRRVSGTSISFFLPLGYKEGKRKTKCLTAPSQRPRRPDQPLPAAAPAQPGGLASLGRGRLARARAEDKPIFLSIGYAACHWCHVMERESFEDEATAAAAQRVVRPDQGRPRGAPRPRRDLHDTPCSC